jgi:putative transposase
VVTASRKPLFAEDINVELLKSAFRYTQSRKQFKINAICVLPDHLHCLWTMPDDSDYSIRWQMIKTCFSRQYRRLNPESCKAQIWQPRFWEHVIRDQDDFDKHLDYIHFNPVKHGLVDSVSEWQYSSFRKFKEQGFYENGWGKHESASISGMLCE